MELKATELRIGNLITVHGHLQEVCNIPLPDNCTDKNTKPIPLTEEWLDKSNLLNGFEINDCKAMVHEHFAEKNTWFFHIGNMCTKIEFVHDLQNWYYSNNNKKELIFKA